VVYITALSSASTHSQACNQKPPVVYPSDDPLSTTTSIIAILQLTATFTGYLHDVRNATKEQKRLAEEAANLYGLLTSLRFGSTKPHQVIHGSTK
jgi:hypothetical protein